jgi:hypothetical protein
MPDEPTTTEEDLLTAWGFQRYLSAVIALTEWLVNHGAPFTNSQMNAMSDFDADAAKIYTIRLIALTNRSVKILNRKETIK